MIKQKDGRRNRYQIQAHLPLPEAASQEPAIAKSSPSWPAARDSHRTGSSHPASLLNLGHLRPHGRRDGQHVASPATTCVARDAPSLYSPSCQRMLCRSDALQRRRLGVGDTRRPGTHRGGIPCPNPVAVPRRDARQAHHCPPSSANACVPWASTPCPAAVLLSPTSPPRCPQQYSPTCCTSHQAPRSDGCTRQEATGPVPPRRRTRPGTRSPDLTNASAAEAGPAPLDMIGTLPVTQ